MRAEKCEFMCTETKYLGRVVSAEHRYFIPFHAAKVQPMPELLKKKAAPNEDGRFVLDTDVSTVAIAVILHKEKQHNGETVLRHIVCGSKSLTRTKLNYGAPKLEMYVMFYFIEKFHSYLAGREFTLRMDNQAFSWLKIYSMDQAMIGRWIARLDQNHFKTIHRPIHRPGHNTETPMDSAKEPAITYTVKEY